MFLVSFSNFCCLINYCILLSTVLCRDVQFVQILLNVCMIGLYLFNINVRYLWHTSIFFKAFNIRRCFVSHDRDLLVKAFTFLGIIPLTGHLRYCKTLYALSKYNVASQNTYLGFKIYYSVGLRRLKLTSLERRRLVTDLLMCIEIVFGLITLHCSNFLQLTCLVPEGTKLM